MKLISITIIFAFAIFILLKINIGGASETEIKKNLNPLQTREIKCAVPVNGVIYGNFPPCDIFSSSKSYNKLKKEYYVDGVVYKSYNDFIDHKIKKSNARNEAYREYKKDYRDELKANREKQRADSNAYYNARADKRKARINKKIETKLLSKKALKAKSRVVKCEDSNGTSYYSNNCSGRKREKELRIVKLPKKDYQRQQTYTRNDAILSSTINIKPPQQKHYSSLIEREKDTRKYFEKLFRGSDFSEAEIKKNVDKYVDEIMSVYR